MTFIARILRFLFWMVIVSAGVSLVRRLVAKMGAAGRETQPDVFVPGDSVRRKLVRDPVCGMHMAETIAIPLRDGNELHHFCSLQCRDKYVTGTRKLAANG
jgi:hypothetical protein